jgi:hypothetical protein
LSLHSDTLSWHTVWTQVSWKGKQFLLH